MTFRCSSIPLSRQFSKLPTAWFSPSASQHGNPSNGHYFRHAGYIMLPAFVISKLTYSLFSVFRQTTEVIWPWKPASHTDVTWWPTFWMAVCTHWLWPWHWHLDGSCYHCHSCVCHTAVRHNCHREILQQVWLLRLLWFGVWTCNLLMPQWMEINVVMSAHPDVPFTSCSPRLQHLFLDWWSSVQSTKTSTKKTSKVQ